MFWFLKWYGWSKVYFLIEMPLLRVLEKVKQQFQVCTWSYSCSFQVSEKEWLIQNALSLFQEVSSICACLSEEAVQFFKCFHFWPRCDAIKSLCWLWFSICLTEWKRNFNLWCDWQSHKLWTFPNNTIIWLKKNFSLFCFCWFLWLCLLSKFLSAKHYFLLLIFFKLSYTLC